MRRQLKTISTVAAESIPATGKHIARVNGEYLGYYNGGQVSYGHDTYREAEAAVDQYVYDELKYSQPATA
jgi:hypothetical protein